MGRYRSLQSIMLAEALKGITDNQTITAYKKDCKLFAAYCKEQGVKRPDQLQGKEKELLQGYEKQLEASGYSPATIHRRLAAPCKATNISMSEIEKPKRTSGKITRSRNEKANRQGKREIEDERYSRLVTFQRAVGIRRAELSRLTGADLVIDENRKLPRKQKTKVLKLRKWGIWESMLNLRIMAALLPNMQKLIQSE